MTIITENSILSVLVGFIAAMGTGYGFIFLFLKGLIAAGKEERDRILADAKVERAEARGERDAWLKVYQSANEQAVLMRRSLEEIEKALRHQAGKVP